MVRGGKVRAGEVRQAARRQGARTKSRALARHRRPPALPGGLLPASRRAALARRGQPGQHLLPLPRRHARRQRHHRAGAGHAGLRARRPQGGRQLFGDRGQRRHLRLLPEQGTPRAARARSAGGILRSGLEQHPMHRPLAVQLSLRLRQFRRSDACLLPARRFVHARIRRQAGRDAGRKARRWLPHRPRRAEGRQSRLDPRGHRRHPGLLPARYSVSGRRRSRRTIPHHRLHDAGR